MYFCLQLFVNWYSFLILKDITGCGFFLPNEIVKLVIKITKNFFLYFDIIDLNFISVMVIGYKT